jgi:miniconductance mechanosensitive channel
MDRLMNMEMSIEILLKQYPWLLEVGIFLLSMASILFLSKKIVIPYAIKLCHRHPGKWATALHNSRIIHLLPHITGAVINIFFLTHLPLLKSIAPIIMPAVTAYLAFSITLLFRRFVTLAEHILSEENSSYVSALRSYSQFTSLLIIIVGGTVSMCLLVNVSPIMFLGSLGAAGAILTLVFKDTILSLMASIQISLHKLIHKGDYIRIDSCNVEGTVMDISLNFIQIKNSDETITVLPTHQVFQSPFKNWHNIHVVQTRLIKKAIFIDQETIVPLTPALIARYKKDAIIQAHVEHVEDYQTNSELFRAYVENWLRTDPRINTEKNIIFRTLDPTHHGLPLELCVFTKEFKWHPHEKLTSSVLEKVIALVPVFGLKVHQGS